MPTQTEEGAGRLRSTFPDPLEVAIELKVRLHRNGALSVEGPVADTEFCRKLLDEAWHAIQRNQRDTTGLIVPERDVDSQPKESYL